MKSAEEIQKQISLIYLNLNYLAAGPVIVKELTEWEQAIRANQRKKCAGFLDEYRDKMIKGIRLLAAGRMDELEKLCPGMKEEKTDELDKRQR